MMLKDLSQKLSFLQGAGGKHARGKRQQDCLQSTDVRESAAPEPEELEGPAERLTDPLPEPSQTASETPSERSLAQADFEAGMRACKEKNYSQALETLLRAAETGHKEAQFLCGQIYERGLAAETDVKRALSWYKRSAKQGFIPAQMICATMYEKGEGTGINMKRALYWYEQAAKQGSVPAQLKCGRMYYCGRAENRNPKKARSWLETAAGLGNEDAKKLLKEFF